MTKYDYVVIVLQFIIGGLLMLLWRRVSEALRIREEILNEIKKIIKEETKKFIPDTVHAILCENASLKIRDHITKEIKVMKTEIVEAIKSANGKGT